MSAPEQTRTLVVNLYGGPGTGKWTSAAAIFAMLKQQDVNAELATEYAKDIVWEGREYLLSDQIYIFAKQNRKLERLYGKVDVIVTDCPLLFSYYYSNKNPHIKGLIFEMLKKANQLHVFLQREKAYNPKGRYQTEEQAKEIDAKLLSMLEELKLDYLSVSTTGAPDEVSRLVTERLQ
jgi:uncharacterized protein YaaR (DUF327 family)